METRIFASSRPFPEIDGTMSNDDNRSRLARVWPTVPDQ